MIYLYSLQATVRDKLFHFNKRKEQPTIPRRKKLK